MAPRCSPVLGSPSGSLRVLTLVVAMTAGCRAVLLAATAFWLAGRRLLKARIYRNGVLVFRQEGTTVSHPRLRSEVADLQSKSVVPRATSPQPDGPR